MAERIDGGKPDRREFLRALARAAAFGGLGVLAAKSAARAFARDEDGACVLRDACASCPSLGGCRLPRAAGARGREEGADASVR